MHTSIQVRAACALKRPSGTDLHDLVRISLLLQAVHILQASLWPKLTVKLNNEFLFSRTRATFPSERVDFVRDLQISERRKYSDIIFSPKQLAGVWWFVQIAPWIAKIRCSSKLSEREIYTQKFEEDSKNLTSGAGYAGCSVESN